MRRSLPAWPITVPIAAAPIAARLRAGMPTVTVLFVAVLFVTVLVVAACASPPNKEMDQAQGAIDAARAAGAEKFATAEFTAATTALQGARDAVSQRDYRVALNNALESREHAQNAARDAADTRVRLRDEYQKTLADLTVQLAAANARFKTTQGRMSRATARELQQSLAGVTGELQEAGAALTTENYAGTQPVLLALRGRITEIIAAIDRAGLQAARRRS
jgi:hypothetical protein